VYVRLADCDIAIVGLASVCSAANLYSFVHTLLQVDDFSELQSVTEYDGGYSRDHATVQQVIMTALICSSLHHSALYQYSICSKSMPRVSDCETVTMHLQREDILNLVLYNCLSQFPEPHMC
jgi:hypothetical protein